MKKGFTLVELALVIVLIGLIVGVINAGSGILESAKIQSTISQISDYQDAVSGFKEKYNSLPGDMVDATSNLTGSGISNGDGDGLIESPSEAVQAWLHLSSAKFVELSGMTGTGTNLAIDTNVPKTSLKGGGVFFSNTSSSSSIPLGQSLSFLGIGAEDGSGLNDAGIIRPENADFIDRKMDDGFSNTGSVVANVNADDAFSDPSQLCRTTGVSPNDYQLSTTTNSCILMFKLSVDF